MAASRGTERRRPIQQDDLFEIAYVCDAVLSPDGRHAAYVLAETRGSADKEQQVLSIWLTATDGSRKTRRLTRGRSNSYHPRFTPDGAELMFVSTRDKLPQIYAMPLDGGEAEQLTELPQGAGPFELSPDGKSLVFAALVEAPTPADENTHARINRFWYRFDPLGGYLHDVQQAVFVLKRGRKPKAVTAAQGLVLAGAFSPDGRHIAVLRTGLPHHRIFEADLSLVDVRGRQAERLLVQNTGLTGIAWGSNSNLLIGTGPGADLARQASLYVIDATTGRMRNRTRTLDLMVGTGLQNHLPVRIASRVIADADGRSAYTTITRGGAAHVNRVSLTGRKAATEIGGGAQVCHLMDRGDSRSLVIRHAFDRPPALFMIDDASGDATQLTHHNEAWHRRFRWPELERVTVRSARGVEIEGWVLKPRHVRAPYKTILTIHGGPHAGYGCGFWSDLHELVGAGYAVAFTNPRGSTGYGDAFCRAILGRWGEPEFEDFNAFLDHLIEAGIAHPHRLGVTGISGGGHLSAWLVGHTRRFKAAVPEQGVYSMVSMWGTSDAGRDLLELEMGGQLHRIPDTYWRLSPIAYAHRCDTPTLLLQGEDDIRCPMEQAEQMFAALRNHGCEAELIPMKRCSHGEQVFGRPALRRFRMNVMKEWFDRHIR